MKNKKLMYGIFMVIFLALSFIPVKYALALPASDNGVKATVDKIKALSVPFIKNVGQTDKRVLFYTNTFGPTVFVTKTGELVYKIPVRKSAAKKGRSLVAGSFSIKESFVGNGGGLHIQAMEPQKIKVNYLTLEKSFKNIPAYRTLSLGAPYKGIEARLTAHGNNVEKLFYVQPGADPSRIQLKVTGAEALEVSKDGRLHAETPYGRLAFLPPRAFQVIEGRKQPVKVAYRLLDKSRYGFSVGPYDRSRELVIDPILDCTYLGGGGTEGGGAETSGAEFAYDILVDGEGKVYVAGSTQSPDFPVTPGAYDTTYSSNDAFVSRFDPYLGTLEASTFLGGGDSVDTIEAMAFDSEGNLVIAGERGAAGSLGFVARLSPDLSTLVTGLTTFGQWENEVYVHDVAIAQDGTVYVAGEVDGNVLPAASGFDATYNGGYFDGFVCRFAGEDLSLSRCTYLGGSGDDQVNSIAVGTGGNVYVAGDTGSGNFPVTEGAFQGQINQGEDTDEPDGFVARLNADLGTLQASTFVGGSGDDGINGLALSQQTGELFVTGNTGSADFPVTEGAYQGSLPEDTTGAAFVSRLDQDLTQLLASTYFSKAGSDHTTANDLLLANGGVYICGDPVGIFGGDAMVALFDRSLSHAVSEVFGGSDQDWAVALAAGPHGDDIYVVGNTHSPDFPVTEGAYDTTLNNGNYGVPDAFVARFPWYLSADDYETLNNFDIYWSIRYDENIIDYLVDILYELAELIGISINDLNVTFQELDSGYIYPFTEIPYDVTGSNRDIGGGSGDYAHFSDPREAYLLDSALAFHFGSHGVRLTRTLHRLFGSTWSGYSLEVQKEGEGTVTSEDERIGCGETCSADYAPDDSVTLTAMPDEGFVFAGWGGDCEECGTDATCALVMDADKACTATFAAIPNEPPVIDAFTADPTEGVAPLEVSFTCQAHDPDGGTIPSIEWFFGDSQGPYYTFDGNFTVTHTYSAAGTYSAYCRVWDDEDQNATSGNITITVSSPVIYHELDVNVAQEEGGSVSSEPEGIACPGDCAESYQEGEEVTLTAAPDEGFVFAGWGGDCEECGSEPTCTLVMDADKSCTATFETAATPIWQDITEMVTTNRSRTLYDRIHRAFFVLIDVENTYSDALSGPIRMVIEDPTIPVKTIEGVGLTPDGVTDDGDPYFIIVPEGESLASGDMLEDLRVNFELQRRRLDFGIRIEQLVQPW